MLKLFISVGENIHCTRTYKVDGSFVKPDAKGEYAVLYKANGQPRRLPIPALFRDGADWAAGKVKHSAVAIWQGVNGNAAGKAAGIEYLQSLAKLQEASGATYLDINVDEFSTDVAERVRLIKWTVDVAQKASSLPMSIDSSNVEILRAGLAACDRGRKRPMLNSLSLERPGAIKVAAEFGAVVIASAAGEKDLPCSVQERLANLDRLLPMLHSAGIKDDAIHIDPLVLPMSTDPSNGKVFIEAVRAVRKKYGTGIHIVAGLSNVSFGMPNRKLLNQVFALLAAEAGADGGIVDPLQVNLNILNGMDRGSDGFKLAQAALMGEDEYGMNYIMAFRDGAMG